MNAVDPARAHALHVRLIPGRIIAFTDCILAEPEQNQDIADADYLVDGTPWFQTAVVGVSSDFSTFCMEIGTCVEQESCVLKHHTA